MVEVAAAILPKCQMFRLFRIRKGTGASFWKCVGHSIESECFEITGVNVWHHKWIPLSNWNVTVHVRDPAFGEWHRFPVYEIDLQNKRIIFASGEYSNGVFGFYVPDES